MMDNLEDAVDKVEGLGCGAELFSSLRIFDPAFNSALSRMVTNSQ
jgi:hypothetical protein